MMRFKQFMEMPLANYKVAPFKRNPDNATQNKHFNQKDRKAIQSPIVLKKLEDVLGRSTGFDFNIILMETDPQDEGGRFMDRKTKFISQIEQYCQQNNIPIENHITFGKNGSSGDPLSSWMILHTLGHALLDNTIAKTNIFRIFNEMIDHFRSNDAILDVPHMAKRVFQFRSSQNLAAQSGDSEIAYELVAEYLWHGKIRTNNNDPGLRGFVARIEQIIEQQLESRVGKIIVDFFE